MKRKALTILLAVCTAVGCAAQRQGPVYEAVRFEDGTPVTDDPEAEALFEQDSYLVDTTFTNKGDTLLTFRHASAFVRLQLDDLPAGIDRISLVPMDGVITVLPVITSESGAFVLWMAKRPGALPATAVIAQGADGRLRSARLPALDLRPGTAYTWTETLITPDAPAIDLKATPLAATLMDFEAGEYSGIAYLANHRYAVVSDDLKGAGLLFFTIPIDRYGSVGEVSMRPATGTVDETGKNRDSEGVAYVPSTGTLYISSEKHQEILEYDLGGQVTRKSLHIPADLSVKAIDNNRGFEALTYNDSTGLFWTTTESPLKKDTFLPHILRLQSFGKDGKPAERFLYQTDEPARTSANTVAYVFGVPALAALDDGRLLVLEREVYVPKGSVWDKLQQAFTTMNLYIVDPVHDTAGILRKSLLCTFKTGALDLANFEGMCLGPTLPDGARTLVLIADSQKGSGGLTNEYVKVILLR